MRCPGRCRLAQFTASPLALNSVRSCAFYLSAVSILHIHEGAQRQRPFHMDLDAVAGSSAASIHRHWPEIRDPHLDIEPFIRQQRLPEHTIWWVGRGSKPDCSKLGILTAVGSID